MLWVKRYHIFYLKYEIKQSILPIHDIIQSRNLRKCDKNRKKNRVWPSKGVFKKNYAIVKLDNMIFPFPVMFITKK